MADFSKEITINMKEGENGLFLTKKDGLLKYKTTITKEQLGSLFQNSWNTGVMPCAGSGIIYMAQKENKKLIVAQQTHKDPSLKRFRHYNVETYDEKNFSTPNTLMFFPIELNGGQMSPQGCSIVLTKNPVFSLNDELFSAYWLWNVTHNSLPAQFRSNICWGNSISWNSAGNQSLGPYITAINHFYTQMATPHYCSNFTMWDQYTKTRTFDSSSFGRLGDYIERNFFNA